MILGYFDPIMSSSLIVKPMIIRRWLGVHQHGWGDGSCQGMVNRLEDGGVTSSFVSKLE